MAHVSDPYFRTFHALRLKGFAKADIVAEVADLPVATVEAHLAGLQAKELATFREARQLWQLTPGGREAHRMALAEDLAGADVASLTAPYQEFLTLNEQFKALCADWQLRGDEPNDHTDQAYDAGVVARLQAIDAAAQPVVAKMGEVLARLGAYGPRLEHTCQRVAIGETNMFTGVMCGSYHDVWMELHEDLILTQGIDRAAEGSF